MRLAVMAGLDVFAQVGAVARISMSWLDNSLSR